ncbi:hypothetical protein FE810_13085 [Thalassotalea litorea]|uniref:Uncharacterized protein n=1 Tax=Thalassotalea litorea TaxID=2020715 RepID=A0A5R9IED8_9GAMM|nr:hypothetical protein [Thalassotalea litorea]TLU61986.1 hypothetical protein FE810_13085 [Thalassotalea litorea]
MRAFEFVKTMISLMPKEEELLSYGLSNEDIVEIQKSFIATRNKDISSFENVSELEKLVTEFEFDSLQVASINFPKEAIKHDMGIITAYWEADPIVVTKNNSIVAIDHSVDSFVLSKCASDSNSFFEALAFVASIYQNSESRLNWAGKHAFAAENCAKLANERESVKFWASLCPSS